jgi:hypothetical protein
MFNLPEGNKWIKLDVLNQDQDEVPCPRSG